MRWSRICVPFLLTACGSSVVQSQRLPDRSWSFTCELSMDECIQRVQQNCAHQRFRILEGVSETRLRDTPPFEREYHSSKLHLVCTDDGDSPLVSFGGAKKPPSAVTAPAAALRPRLCTTGETRACVGPGACKGGQACLADGSGFGMCDCGPVSAAPAPTADAPAAVQAPQAAPAP